MPRWDLDGGYIRRALPRSGGRAVRRHSFWRVAVWGVAGLAFGLVLATGAVRARQRPPRTELVGWGTVEQVVAVRALVIRHEQVEVAPISGVLLRLAAEGQRVPAKSTVAEVVNPEAQAALQSRQRAVEEAWTRFEKESEGQRRLAAREAAGQEARVAGVLADVRSASVAADMDGLRRSWSGLGQAWLQMEKAREDSARLERQRALLLSERAKLATLTRDAEVRLDAGDGGAVFYQVDGLEPLLSPDHLDMVDLSQVGKPPAALSPAGDRVEAGQPLFRVVDPEDVVLGFLLLEPDAEALVRRGSVDLRLAGSPQRQIYGRVISLGTPQADGYRPVFVRANGTAGDVLLTSRVLEVSVLIRTAQGPRVSVSDLAPQPDSPVPEEAAVGVWVATGSRPVWTPVTVIASDGATAVVEGIRAGTTLVREGTRRRNR